MPERTYELQFLDTLRTHLLNARVGADVGNTAISNTSTRVLFEYCRMDTPSVEEVANLLRINKSTVSRAIQYFEKIRYIELHPSSTRRLSFSLTERGEHFLLSHERAMIERANEQLTRLGKSEAKRFGNFMHSFCEHQSAPEVIPKPDESRVLISWRRISYAHGVMSGDYLQSGYSAEDWLILSELHYEHRDLKSLQFYLGKSQAALSQKLKRMTEDGLLKSAPLRDDKRRRSYRLTSQGRTALNEIETFATQKFSKGLTGLSDEEKTDFLFLLRKYVGPLERDSTIETTPSSLTLKTTFSEEERQVLRRLFVTHALKQNIEIPAILFHPENNCLAFLDKDNYIGAIEIDHNNSRRINSFLLDQKREPECTSLLKESLDNVSYDAEALSLS